MQERYNYRVNGIKNLRIEDLSNHFSKFGSVIDVTMIPQEKTINPYSFVVFDSPGPHDEDRVLGLHNIKGINVNVERAKDYIGKVCWPQ